VMPLSCAAVVPGVSLLFPFCLQLQFLDPLVVACINLTTYHISGVIQLFLVGCICGDSESSMVATDGAHRWILGSRLLVFAILRRCKALATMVPSSSSMKNTLENVEDLLVILCFSWAASVKVLPTCNIS
ncbi:hypothetical protein EJB05_30413, partial [Eragrostis curvula]